MQACWSLPLLAEERRRAYRHPAKRTRELIALLEDGPDLLDCPDTELCGALVAEIIVESNDTLRFRPRNVRRMRDFYRMCGDLEGC